MATILVDNWHVRDIFRQMIAPNPQRGTQIRVLCISAQSGKGKSTVVDYLMEYCREQNVLPIRIDFDAFHISDELELIDTVISQFENVENASLFPNYREAVERLVLTSHSDTVIENVRLVNTHIGTICVQKEDYTSKTKLQYLENAFFQDLKRLAKSLKCKVVFFLDAYECAEKEIQAWIQNKLMLSNRLGLHILVVVASQSDFTLSPGIKSTYGIQNCYLPDTYEFEDWVEYGKQLHIRDTEIIERCYKYWKGDPFYMCITLKPFANQEGK